MPTIANITAWVQVDNKPLPEYQIEHSHGGTQATCWIPSEAGKEFQICYRDDVRSKTTASKLKVDGNRCPGKIVYSKQSQPNDRSPAIHKGITGSDNTFRPYVFSDCRLVGTFEDESDQLLADLSALGEIKIKINEARVGSSIPRLTALALPVLQIHEKAKKGIVHGTQLGNAVLRPGPASNIRKTDHIRTIATFVFRYRPMAVLMANGIAPQAPVTPVKREHAASSSKSIDVIDLTLDDDSDHSRANRTRRKSIRVKREDNTVIDLTI